MMRLLSVFVVFFFFACFSGITCAEAASASSLNNQYQQLKEELAQSIFGSPILLNSTIGNDSAQGEVFALLDTPFSALHQTLSQPAQWCELVILHVNIKTCVHRQDQLSFYVGRKHYQPPEDTFALHYQFKQLANDNEHLHINLSATKGPLGTSNYLITLEAVPIDDQHSFIRFQYRYQFGFMANMAMKTYLATLGRNKVGFTVIGKNKQGEPIYIKGLQGVIERNVMRYIFAIQAVLDAKKSPAEYSRTAEIMRWYAHIQKHPKQLVELSREEYMSNKKRELANQQAMQNSALR